MRNKSKMIKKLASIALALLLAAQPLATLPMNVFAGTGSTGIPTAPTIKKVENFEILGAQETVNVGDEFTLTAGIFSPNDAHEDYKKVEWKVTSDDIDADSISVTKADTTATISVAEPGTVTIIATAKNGLGENKSNEWIKASVNITVLQPVTGITGFEGLPAGSTMDVGKTYTLSAKFDPTNVSNVYKTVEWKSDTPGVAEVDLTGKVTPVAPGTAKITATAKNGSTNQDDWKSASVNITVRPAATSVTLNKSVLALNSDTNGVHEETLQATILPPEADKTVTWSSDKPAVAEVDENGKVIAKAQGEATITARAANGLSATCKVYVDVVVIKNTEAPAKSWNTNKIPDYTINPFTVTFDNNGRYSGNCCDDRGWYFNGSGGTATVTSSDPNITIQKCKFYTSNGSVEVTQIPFTCVNVSCLYQIDVYFTRNAN